LIGVTAAGSTAATDENPLGLTEAEAERRLAQFGANALVETHVSALAKLFFYFWGPMPWMIELPGLIIRAGRSSRFRWLA